MQRAVCAHACGMMGSEEGSFTQLRIAAWLHQLQGCPAHLHRRMVKTLQPLFCSERELVMLGFDNKRCKLACRSLRDALLKDFAGCRHKTSCSMARPPNSSVKVRVDHKEEPEHRTPAHGPGLTCHGLENRPGNRVAALLLHGARITCGPHRVRDVAQTGRECQDLHPSGHIACVCRGCGHHDSGHCTLATAIP